MKIGAKYSHLNGLEWLQVHHPNYWAEIRQTIASVDAMACRTKVSQERKMAGKKLFSPPDLNSAFKKELVARNWSPANANQYYVTDDENLTRQILSLEPAEQKKKIIEAGKQPISTSNAADFHKDRISIEVQFGKYSFVQFDLFIKHAANYMHNRIDLGIEIVPMKSMEREMSSGPPYFEKHLHEIVRQGRIFPPVPLILIGIEP